MRIVLSLFGAAVALLAMFSCARSPASPAPPGQPLSPSSNFSGVWQVQYNVTDFCCLDAGHTMPAFPWPTAETVFRFLQNGSIVTGSMFGVDVSGTMDGSSEVVLKGTKTPVTAGDSQIELDATLRLVNDRSAVGGSFHYVTSHRFDFGVAPLRDTHTTGVIGTSSRAFIDPSTGVFNGKWEGQFGIESCAPVVWVGCYPMRENSVGSMTLLLTQNGSSVSGQLTTSLSVVSIPVTGTVDGGVLRIAGSTTRAVSGGTDSEQLLSFSATRDGLGRMRGSFTYYAAYIKDAGGVNSTTYDAKVISASIVP